MNASIRSLPPRFASNCPRPPPRVTDATPRVRIDDAMPHIIDGGYRLWHALERCLPLEDVLALGVRIHRDSEGAISRDDWWQALVDGLATANEARLALAD